MKIAEGEREWQNLGLFTVFSPIVQDFDDRFSNANHKNKGMS